MQFRVWSCLVFFGWMGFFGNSTSLWAKDAPLKVGSVISKLSLTTSSGKKVNFSDLNAKVVLVNFWASWCAPCVAELPSIIDLWKKYHEKGFAVVAINRDEDSKAGIATVSEGIKFPFEPYVDPNEEISKKFQVESFPLTVILNQKGKVLLIERSEKKWNTPDMHKKLEQWLLKSS